MYILQNKAQATHALMTLGHRCFYAGVNCVQSDKMATHESILRGPCLV